MADLGTDLSGISDLDPAMLEVSGRTGLAQAIARRLITPRGRLIDDPNYGFDLTGRVGNDLGPRDIAILESGIEAECLKDERVITADVTVVLGAGGILTVSIGLQDGAGPFTLVLAVSDVTVALLTVPR